MACKDGVCTFEPRVRGFEIAKGFEAYNLTLPERKTAKSAGYDIRAFITADAHGEKKVIIQPNQTVAIHTGIKAYMQDNEVLKLYIRSGLAFKQNLGLINQTGIVDADYYSNPDNDGHIMIGLHNYGTDEVTISCGDRIAQGIFEHYYTVDDDNATAVREGGIGSTGNA